MKLNKLPLNVIGLNRVGLNQIGSPSRRANTSDRPYIDPEVLASLVAVCICDGKSNNDPDRAVIKNLVDPDNPFVISNAAFKLNSGYGKYEEDFTSWRISKSGIVSTINVNSIHVTRIESSIGENLAFFENRTTTNKKFNIKLKISGLTSDMKCTLNNENSIIKELVNGVNEISVDLVTGWYGFTIIKLDGSIIGDCDITITQIPSHQGAFVTDGKDDLITSTKTVKEMLGGSNEVTVVSMVHQIGLSSLTTINNIRSESVGHVVCRNICSSAGKTGIYGYSRQINTNNPPTLINNILGDKKDYTAEGNSALDPTDKFFVQGYKYSGSISEVSPIAYYWTFIANKALTTDQINQVISYFNLDKHVKPDVYYDVKKQGLSNDTPEVDWYLKDFSGNGHDMQLYNFAKKLGSGIGKYEADYSTWIKTEGVISTPFGLKITEPTHNYWILYTSNITVPAHKVKILGIPEGGEFRYLGVHILKNGINELPKMEEHPSAIGFTLHRGTTQPSDWVGLSVEQIPDYEGALVSDGIDDYGKVENLPIYKDYTVAIERRWITSPVDKNQCLAFKGHTNDWGAFACEFSNAGQLRSYTFSPTYNILQSYNEKSLVYQSKHSYSGTPIDAGETIDGSTLQLCLPRGGLSFYANVAIKMFLLFPYSLSEFLIERQLKKHKLGTLYPGMIEWRPKVNINVPVVTPPTFSMNNGSDIIITNGQYIPEGTEITIRIFTTTDSSVVGINEATAKINGVDIELSPSGNKTYYGGKFIVSSKQKIDITIDEYIRYEDIVQPYPAIINLKQDGKTITWGDKLKVGSDIVFVGSANLLPELYTVSETQYNGVTLYPNTIIKVEKSMVFDNARTYLKANEPSCILSPNRLRIPNSSYKILGYIPDLTGKGNHGIINNSAYAGMSGANGYTELEFSKWGMIAGRAEITIPNDVELNITKVIQAGKAVIHTNTGYYTTDSIQRYRVTGVDEKHPIVFGNDAPVDTLLTVTTDGEYEVDWKTYGKNPCIFTTWTGDCNITIEQIGQYEGSFCLDGVDDFITIPTLASGAKQVLMKVNWSKINTMLYDQRGLNNLNEFGIFASDTDSNNNETKAYYSRNNGSTYIDGVLNTFISSSLLKDITHNIICTNKLDKRENIGIHTIGRSSLNSELFGSIRLYSFMSFSEISSEEEIQELNDIVGIENNIEVS